MRAFLVLGTVMLTGCGETEPIGPDPDATSSSGNSMGGDGSGAAGPGGGFESGGRLKLRTLVGSDGARSPAGWWDSALEVECSFGTAADGSTRCLPASQPAGAYFSDPGCSTPIVAATCGVAPAYVSIVSDVDCANGPRLFRVAEPIAPSTVYTAGITPCTEQDAPGVQFYKVAAESQPSVFVEAVAEVDN